MGEVTLIGAEDMGNDVLIVSGTIAVPERRLITDENGAPVRDDAGEPQYENATRLDAITAQGWVSAMTHHVDDPPEEGAEAPTVHTREMTPDERRAYCMRLLIEQNPAVAVAVGTPIDLGT